MQEPANRQLLDEITGALDWWREAGVDFDYLDEPREWLSPPEDDAGGGRRERRPPPPPPPAEVRPPEPRIDPAALPCDLAAFRQWWMHEPLLDAGSTAGRVAPQGMPGAAMMVVVEMPEAQDRDSLLCGQHGALLDAILSAHGTNREEVYLASALPRAMPAPDWAVLDKAGIGQVLAHHIALAAPQRLIVLGGNVLPLIGHESPQRPAVLRTFNHEGLTIPLLASWGLDALLHTPRAKPVLWRTWLEWSAA